MRRSCVPFLRRAPLFVQASTHTHTHTFGKTGLKFGSDLAQPAAPLHPSSELSPDDSQTQQQYGSSALLCKGK